MRERAVKAAMQFVSEHFPACRAALLAGSHVRGEGTSTSDLDIVVVDERVPSAYRESLHACGFPIELFVHNLTSYKTFFRQDAARARPSLPTMAAESVVLVGDALAAEMKQEAAVLLAAGPPHWTSEEIEAKRYTISELLEDFEGSSDPQEDLFTVQALAVHLHEFELRTKGHWIGEAKWIMRALRNYDRNFAERFYETFERFWRAREREALVAFAEEILRPHGGRLFEGFSRAKSM
ncbi:MAG TPA: nucleotidyltransferase domain-containing protein [Bacillales bacterium]|nr:nucleotidyltransferase domain-containing protein [Bacillales bacterium]